MAHSIRVLYGNQTVGRSRKNFNWWPIKKNSPVVITACVWHVDAAAGNVWDGRPLLDDHVSVHVTNVGPHDPEGGDAGGVEFFIHVDATQPVGPVLVAVTITVLEDVEKFVA